MRRRLASNFLALALVRGFAIVGPLIVMPYLIKTVGLEGWGMISFALATTSFGGAIVLYGFPVSATANVARVQKDRPRLERSWRSHFSAALYLAAGVGVAGLTAILALERNVDMRLLLAGGLIWSLASSLVPIWLFLGLERIRPAVLSNFFNQIGYVVLVLLLIRTPEQVRWVTMLGAAAAAVGLVVSLLTVRYLLKLHIPLKAGWRKVVSTLGRGFPVFLMMFVPLLYNAGAIFVLGITSSNTEVGLFAVAMTVAEVAILPGRLLASGGLAIVASDPTRFRTFVAYSLGTGVMGALIIAAISPFVANWLTPEHATQTIALMVLLALSIPFGFGQLVFGQNYLAINGQEELASRIVVICSIIGAVLTVIVVPWAGALGAAAVILVSRMLLGGASFIAYRRVSRSGAGVAPATNRS